MTGGSLKRYLRPERGMDIHFYDLHVHLSVCTNLLVSLENK